MRVEESLVGACQPRLLGITPRIMKGSPKVIEELNKALREELKAVNQYFLHAEMSENRGYERLSEYIKKQSIGEMKHASPASWMVDQFPRGLRSQNPTESPDTQPWHGDSRDPSAPNQELTGYVEVGF